MIKTYEGWIDNIKNKFKKEEYNIGDYVLVDVNKTDIPLKPICKIIDIDKDFYIVLTGDGGPEWGILKSRSRMIIKRKLTPEEVEEIELKVDSDKYNL